MKDEIMDLFDGVDLDDISDLDDITPDNVSDILDKYKLDKISKLDRLDISDGDKILNEAYALVNNIKDDDNEDEALQLQLDKLNEEISNINIEDDIDINDDENNDIETSVNNNSNIETSSVNYNDLDEIKTNFVKDDINTNENINTKEKVYNEGVPINEAESKDSLLNDLSGVKEQLGELENTVEQEEMNMNNSDDISENDIDDIVQSYKKEFKSKLEVDDSDEDDIRIVKNESTSSGLESTEINIKKESLGDNNKKENPETNNKQENNIKKEDLDRIVQEKREAESLANSIAEKEREANKSVKEKASDLFKSLFYNVQDEEYERQQRKLERKEQRKKEAKKKEAEKIKADKAIKAEEKKKKAAEDKAAKAKEAAEAKKKKAEEKKKQQEKKKKQKEELAKAMEDEPVGKINKLGAVVVFLFVGVLTFGIILVALQTNKVNNYKEEAINYMAIGNYEQAYMTLLKDDDSKLKESELYIQLHHIQKLNKKLSYYSSNMALQEREKALDALLSGVEIYNDERIYAKKIGVEEEYNSVYEQILVNLKSEFKLSEKQAKEIVEINSKETYSEKIKEICKRTRK